MASKARANAPLLQRTDLEDFFLQCIEDTKKGIERRRRNASATHRKKPLPRVSSNSPLSLDEAARGSGAPPTITREDFTSTDREMVVHKLLQRDDVLSMIFEHMFPTDDEEGEHQTGRHQVSASMAQRPTSSPSMISRSASGTPALVLDEDLQNFVDERPPLLAAAAR